MVDVHPLEDINIPQFYDLTQVIERRTDHFTKDEIESARNIAISEIGSKLVSEKKPELIFYDDGNKDKLIIIYVIFNNETKDEHCLNMRIWIHGNKIVQIKYE